MILDHEHFVAVNHSVFAIPDDSVCVCIGQSEFNARVKHTNDPSSICFSLSLGGQ